MWFDGENESLNVDLLMW